MAESLRRPLFIVALILMVIVVAIEVGSAFILNTAQVGSVPTPGLGITYMALVDGILLYLIILMGLSLIIPPAILGRVQGIATFIFSLLMIIGAIVLLMIAIGLLILMVTLLLAIPFGTIVYFAAYADFKVGAATATLGTIMFLKMWFAGFLAFSNLRFLKDKLLVLLVLTSFLINIIISFLHGFMPGFLVSITDAIAAIVFAILSIIWAIIFLITAIPAIIKALRVDKAL